MEQILVPLDRSIVDQRRALRSQSSHGGNLCRVADISDRAPAAELMSHRSDELGVDVDCQHVVSISEQPCGDRLADPLTGSGHNGGATLTHADSLMVGGRFPVIGRSPASAHREPPRRQLGA